MVLCFYARSLTRVCFGFCDCIPLALQKAIVAMKEKLQKQLHFKSLVSSKVYYGLDCDKQMQENVRVQLRLLEHEYNRKRNMKSECEHKNSELQHDIDEYRLQKCGMRESGMALEAKFAEKQETMRQRMADANVMKMSNHKIEDALEQLTIRAETQINQQSEDIQELRRELEGHQRAMEEIEQEAHNKELDKIQRAQAGQLSLEEEQEMRQKMRELRHDIVDEAKRVEDSAQRIMNHEQAFERLRQETNLSDLGEIVKRFVTREDENFAIYSHLQRVEETLQKEEQKLRDLETQTEEYLETAKTRQGSTSNKYESIQRQKDQLQAKNKAQEGLKAGLQSQQGQWTTVVFDFLKTIVASGISFESKLLTQPATVALLDKVRESLQDVKADEEDPAAREAKNASLMEGNLEIALSVIEQCTSEVMSLSMPYLHDDSMKTLNRYGMHSPSNARSHDRHLRWSIDPPTFTALEDDGAITPFDSNTDREALFATISKRAAEKPQRRTTAKAAVQPAAVEGEEYE